MWYRGQGGGGGVGGLVGTAELKKPEFKNFVKVTEIAIADITQLDNVY